MDDLQFCYGLEAMTPSVLCRDGLFGGAGLLPGSWWPVMLLDEGSRFGVIAEVRVTWKHHLVKGGLGIVPPLQGLYCLLQVLPFFLCSCTAPTLPVCSVC